MILPSKRPFSFLRFAHLILSARHVCRTAGDRQILNEIDFNLTPGQTIGLSGPSGSGKSSLLRALALIDPIDTGTIRVDDRPVFGNDVPAFRRRCVYLAQRPAMIAGTVEDNLRLPFQWSQTEMTAGSSSAFDRSAAESALRSVGRAKSLLNQNAAKLSGGESQIVALIRALSIAPEILLLDEPTASLDAETTTAVETLVRNWHDADPDRSLVWASHDIDQLERMTDCLVVIRSGRVFEKSVFEQNAP